MATEEEKLKEEILKLKKENLELRRQTSNVLIRKQYVIDVKRDRTPYYISVRAISFNGFDKNTLQRVAQEQYLNLKSKSIIPNNPVNQGYEEIEITRFELNKLKGHGLHESNILIEFLFADRKGLQASYYIIN